MNFVLARTENLRELMKRCHRRGVTDCELAGYRALETAAATDLTVLFCGGRGVRNDLGRSSMRAASVEAAH